MRILLRFIRKLKPLDYLIILIVLLAVFILFRFLNPEEKWIDAVIVANEVPFFQAHSLHVGDIEKDPNGEKTAEIVRIKAYDTPTTLQVKKDVLIRLKLLVKVNSRSGEYEYKNKIIKVGSPIELRFNTGQFNGKVAELDVLGDKQYEDKTLTLIVYDEWPWLADSIKIGAFEKDDSNQKIIEVLEKQVQTAEMTVVDEAGNTLLRTNPRKVDITLKIKVKVRKFGEELIIRQDEKIAIGENIAFNAGETRIKEALIENVE